MFEKGNLTVDELKKYKALVTQGNSSNVIHRGYVSTYEIAMSMLVKMENKTNPPRGG